MNNHLSVIQGRDALPLVPASGTAIEIENLTVNYGSFTALREFSVEIPQGCVGLLGPNGAGKTTLLKTLLGFVQPAAGTASLRTGFMTIIMLRPSRSGCRSMTP